MSNAQHPIYQLRFFFDYHCGGCLWCSNAAAYEKYDGGVLDAEIFDSTGKQLMQEAKIQLPAAIRQKVWALDKQYSESLNWNDPGGNSMWSEADWATFYGQARALYEEICGAIGHDFEIIYAQ